MDLWSIVHALHERNLHYFFKNPEDLIKVKGISLKTMEKLRDQITVEGE